MWNEYPGDQSNSGEVGEIHLNTEYTAARKPAWLVLLKLIGLVIMFGVGFTLLLPFIPLATWQAVALAAGVLLIYVGLAFFFRPEPNEERIGQVGWIIEDEVRYADEANRFLCSLHCFLGPGRFVAETILDTCTLLGLRCKVETGESRDEDASFHTHTVSRR